MASSTTPTLPPREQPSTWATAPGLEVLGVVQDSGMSRESFLLRREDGQVVQVSRLLHDVVAALDPARPPHEIAGVVSESYGRTLTVDGLTHLIENRLRPLGLVAPAAGAPTGSPPQARPLLTLTLKGTLVSQRWVGRISSCLTPAYWPPVVLAVLLGAVALDVVLWRTADLGGAARQLLASPVLFLLAYVLLTVGALIHEMGHATACRYGGGRPGRIGFGVYLVFPAFYTDVTDSYRLSRRARLRTDLGGLYFNVLCLVFFSLAYLGTGQGLFLLVCLIMHLEMVQQLIPAVRFDGYYVLADLAGVPDLFARIGPVLRSLLPGRPADPRVSELRASARRLVVAWVLLVVPTLFAALAWTLWHLPEIARNTGAAIGVQRDQLFTAWPSDVPVVAISVISIALLAIPLLGIGVLIWRLARILVGAAGRFQRRLKGQRPDPA